MKTEVVEMTAYEAIMIMLTTLTLNHVNNKYRY